VNTINPRMITLAREAEGLTQSALAHSAGVSQATLSKVEHGLEEPNAILIDSMASECKVPREFFVQADDVLGESVVDFYHRKRLTLPAKPLKRAHAVVNVIRLETLRLLRQLELTDVAPFPTLPSNEYSSPTEVAALVRGTWRIPAGPLPDLVSLIEAAGVPIVTLDLGHEKLSAVSLPGLESRHVVVLNSALPASHQRFALAHELGHLVMHSAVPTPEMETDADEFASAFLMPSSDIEPQLRGLRFRDLGTLKSIWRVSLAALIRRAHDLGSITDRQYRWFNMQLNKLPGGRKHEPGEFAREEPRLMRHVVEHYQRDLGYNLDDLARLMITERETLAERYLGEPPRTLRAVGQPSSVYRLSAADRPT
jgi:Zn-dependent peptidase ImmA (M78 family)/transcriptional regulator with XRE-family HTH domain